MFNSTHAALHARAQHLQEPSQPPAHQHLYAKLRFILSDRNVILCTFLRIHCKIKGKEENTQKTKNSKEISPELVSFYHHNNAPVCVKSLKLHKTGTKTLSVSSSQSSPFLSFALPDLSRSCVFLRRACSPCSLLSLNERLQL